MKEITVKVPSEVVKDIQTKDLKVQAMQSVITNLMEMHAMDESPAVLTSNVFITYQSMLVDAKREFELAKDKMINDVLDKSTQRKVTKWSLNYVEEELVYTIG